MKKIVIVVLATLLILAHGLESDYLPGIGTATNNQISYNGQLITATKCTDYQLNAGAQFEDYGDVRVCNTQFDLYIGVYAFAGFKGSETIKIWVGTSLLLLPVSGSGGGRPIAGKFDYKSPTFDTTTYYWSIKIPFSSIKLDSTDPKPTCNAVKIYVYVHVDCANQNTCFGGDICVPSDGQAWYCSIAYVTECPASIVVPNCATDPNQDGCPTFSCETAFAFGNRILVNTSNPDNLPIADLTNKSKRWGWAYLSPSTSVTATYNIYAGAGLNYISKGYLVGNVTYTWDSVLHKATAQVNIASIYYLNSYHIHIGDSLPGNIAAPGQYSGCLDSFGYPQSQYSVLCAVDNIVDVNSDGIWFITHLGICKTF